MKRSISILSVLTLLFLTLSCSENNSLEPTSPQDNEKVTSLEKAVLTNFTFTDYPIAEPSGGTTILTPGGKWQAKKIEVLENFISSDPLINGTMVHYLSHTIDAVTGEGHCHGSLTITPTDQIANGGVWEGTYQGYRSETNVSGESTVVLKIKAHGLGGTIDGMQLFGTNTITVRADGPTTLPTSWEGVGEGFYKSH